MKLSELSINSLLDLIENAKHGETMSELLREVMAEFYKKSEERVTLTDMIAFGWEVADELVKRLQLQDRYEDD